MNKKRLIYAEAASNGIEWTRRKMLDTRLRIGGAGDWLNGYTDGLEAVAEFIKQAPAVDAVEVVHGRWIPTYHTYYNRDGACQIADEWHCSNCDAYSRDTWNYCPNCGAKMDGDENEA